MKSYQQIRRQALLIYDFYLRMERELVEGMDDGDWDDPAKLKIIATTQKRRAMAGRILGIGRIYGAGK